MSRLLCYLGVDRSSSVSLLSELWPHERLEGACHTLSTIDGSCVD